MGVPIKLHRIQCEELKATCAEATVWTGDCLLSNESAASIAKLHMEKLLKGDFSALRPRAPLVIQTDLQALDAVSNDLEYKQMMEQKNRYRPSTYTVTQAITEYL